MNKMTNVGRCSSVDDKAVAEGKGGVVVDGDRAAPNDIESRMVDQDATVTITKAEWQKLMSMLHTLSANQAELNKNQAELISQLSRANERVKELEETNAQLVAKQMTTGALSHMKNGQTQREKAPRALSRAPSFNYISKRVPSTSNEMRHPAQKNVMESAQAPQKKTWAQIAAAKRPSMNDVSQATQEGLRKCLALLDIQSPEPKPTALYFRNIRRARLGQVRKALRQMFTHPWAVLGLSFIGQSVIEIVCHEALVHQVVGKLRLIGASHIKNMDVFGDNLKKMSQKDNRNRAALNLERAQQRFERLVETCVNPAAKQWYNKQAEEAERRLAQIYQRSHDVETDVSEESGYESNEVETDETMNPAEPSSNMPNDTQATSDMDEGLDEIQPVKNTSDQAPEAPQQH